MTLRILVVDDQQDKLRRIIDALLAAGVTRDTIVTSQNGFDATDLLRRTKFDLAVVDIALPHRPEDIPNPSVGLELIAQIYQSNRLKPPDHIIATTAYEEYASKLEERFSDRLIHVIVGDPTSDVLETKIAALARSILANRATETTLQYDVDLCLITALRQPELKAVQAQASLNLGEAELLDDSTLVHRGSLTTADGKALSVVASAAPRMGPVHAAIHASRLISRCRPRLLAVAGICAGVEGKAAIGDVILASPVWDWQSGKYVNSSTDLSVAEKRNKSERTSTRFMLDLQQLDVEPNVETHFIRLADDSAFWRKMYDSWPGPKPETTPRGRIGPVASGSSVLADGFTIKRISEEQHRKLTAVEMECFGIYAAARQTSSPKPIFFAAKAVCDLGDASKSDTFQDYAATISARCVEEFVRRYFSELTAGQPIASV